MPHLVMIVDFKIRSLCEIKKKEIGRITKIDGIVVSCGWNSGGIGKKYGFEMLEVLLVPHGGQHNDTIVTVEKKVQKLYKSDETLIG